MGIFIHVKNNNLFELKKYLQFGNVNITDDNKKSLLHHAVEGKSIDCLNLLIDSYINLNITDDNNQTALFDCCMKGNLGIVKVLINNKIDVNIKDCYGNIALFYAIRTNKASIVDLLLLNSDLNSRNLLGEDALLIAIKYQYHAIDKFLKQESNNSNNDTIIHYACRYNNFELIKKFSNRLNVLSKNNHNEDVFFIACKYSNREIVRFLLDFMPSVDIKNKYEESLIEVAKLNYFDISDIIENYKNSLEFLDYKKHNKIIYDYISNKNLINIDKKNINKKDNFGLSLIEYLNFFEDKVNIKVIKTI